MSQIRPYRVPPPKKKNCRGWAHLFVKGSSVHKKMSSKEILVHFGVINFRLKYPKTWFLRIFTQTKF